MFPPSRFFLSFFFSLSLSSSPSYFSTPYYLSFSSFSFFPANLSSFTTSGTLSFSLFFVVLISMKKRQRRTRTNTCSLSSPSLPLVSFQQEPALFFCFSQITPVYNG
ncbi:hypothetical protein BCR41DRAFT_176828 [Lobosporangium transversale]|uniref:REJ domain-containing protein n=1 Tax=Lobosporangium transversale TaxID=64571 RepID=A0A1Y2GC67_9FUNG|nr:hypothetical protein BCR41DRAFT_176828 [Lobosporangium transversale]ORZ05736.1 hypothetical protein BCR41DRAFT_176828 [Lobosporangium transversale]|eukprot:XP_021877223.1 hypothetical protein BCR41DRAFT_176828 [Lobosporangium transversale]